MWGIISAVVSIPGTKLSTPMQHHIQKSQRVSLEEICLDTLAYLSMLCDMRNYAPLTWGQHRLLSICAHWKNHMKSISPKLSVHTFFLYQYSLQASVSLFPHLSCHLSSTPPSVSTTQPSSLTHTHFPQLVSAFSRWSVEKKAVQRSGKLCGFEYEVQN